ncbi:hypothetical protein GH733_005839 [Mirounga leonina]|nr:hypothetical protein GH733_005839 [Mirounga leonina]
MQLMFMVVLFAVLLFYEFLIYYLVVFQYSWPEGCSEGGAPSRLTGGMGRCQVFSHPPQVKLSAVAGNHDLGFHSQMKAYKLFSGKRINFAMGLALPWKGMVGIIVLSLVAEFLESSHKWKGSHQHQHCYNQCRDKQQFLAAAQSFGHIVYFP